jgi:cytochrome c6
MKIKAGLVLAVLMAGGTMTTAFAEGPGADIYKTRCQICHGVSGLADSAAGKAMKVKPLSDASVKTMAESQMIEAVRNGMGKMQPYKDKLTDVQIKDAVGYFRTMMK